MAELFGETVVVHLGEHGLEEKERNEMMREKGMDVAHSGVGEAEEERMERGD